MNEVESFNIARHLPLRAASSADRPALKIPRGRTGNRIDYLTLTYAELDTEADGWAHRIHASGVRPGDRVLVMVRQGLPLIASVFALFKLGAVPVVIDPGMGLSAFLRCVQHTRPRALLGIWQAQWLSRMCFKAFSSVDIRIAVKASPLARAPAAPAPFPCQTRQAKDLAAVLFTSGSTGAPKGVCYEHGMFAAQVESVRRTYAIEAGEVDLPMLPIFALFNPALGMTTVVPEIDPSRPAQVDPARIVQAIIQEGVTNSFGSPTLWDKIATHCIQNKITLPSLRRVLSAGAPVPLGLWEAAAQVLPNGRLHSPYGATESLPVSTVCSGEIDPTSAGGACVGKPVNGVEVRIVPLSETMLPGAAAAAMLPPGERGEIIVRSPQTTRDYFRNSLATEAAKIPDPTGFWHRMGDIGYLDTTGRLWFCGRKVERVHTAEGPLDTEPVEQVFRRHPRVRRCALIGLGEKPGQRAALVIEPTAKLSRMEEVALARELRLLGHQHPQTRNISHFFVHPSLPVDVRHNAKIHRLALARWAVGRVPFVVA